MDWLNLSDAAGIYFVVYVIANFLARRIPDDTTGVLGWVRDISQIVGVFAHHRVAGNETVADVAKRTRSLATEANQKAQLAVGKARGIEERIEELKPKVPARGPGGKFKPASKEH